MRDESIPNREGRVEVGCVPEHHTRVGNRYECYISGKRKGETSSGILADAGEHRAAVRRR